MERFEFQSEGLRLIADLHLPERPGPHPGVVLLGPLTSVKEQVTGRYAEELARRGYAALSFDPAHFGESEGQPRSFEYPQLKAKNARDGAVRLAEHPAIDPNRLFALGVCAGAGYLARAVAEEARFRAFGAVAGFFHDATQQKLWMGAEKFELAVERARAAREHFEETGHAEFIPAVGQDGEVAMPLDEAFEYYGTDRGGRLGHYKNEFAVMSRERTLLFDAQGAAEKITVPVRMVHSENALSPALARSFFDKLSSRKKDLFFHESTGQIDFYDDPLRIQPAVEKIIDCFDQA